MTREAVGGGGATGLPRPGDPAVPAPREGSTSAASTVGREPPRRVHRRPLAATVKRLRAEVRAAQAEADGRALIELAKGVMIERLRCGPAQAARQLTELAAQAGMSPLELAADIVNQAARDQVAQVADDFVRQANAAPGDEGTSGDSSVAVRLRTAECAALAASDTQAVAESLLEHALAPLGATAVAVWAAGSDASLTLCGHAGFSADEADRWRYVPPGVATVARHALADLGMVRISALAEAGVPSVGHRQAPDGGRIALPAGTGGRMYGVLEICWPHRLPEQPPAVLRQIEALAELCAHTLESLPAAGARHPGDGGEDVSELVDLAEGLYDPALVLTPHLDAEGTLVDFRIRHVNSHFLDPAGRPRGAVSGAFLLEAYPMVAGDSELFEKTERVYATGEPFRARRMTLTALVDEVPLSSVADLSITRHHGSVLLIWRIEDEICLLYTS
ncbi:ANTAR domain-containing protein, partial [Streptomyces sp. NRRL WC-3549]|uniref:ANTAR domain-containing protein n=1 Tax=Streptomyces sp. NRRL WC-3549 TaxID=1463925 RepID=UPI00131A7667